MFFPANVGKGYVILAKMFRMLRKLEVVEFYQCILCPAVGECESSPVIVFNSKRPSNSRLSRYQLSFGTQKNLAELL